MENENSIMAYGYMVITENEELKEEILNNTKKGNTRINWFNFNKNDKFYNDNGEEFIIIEIYHDTKIVVIE